jgi:ATP-dependent DNA ligase
MAVEGRYFVGGVNAMTKEGSRLRGAEPSKSELKEAPINSVFRHARKMGLEGIVSKRLGSTYRSRRSPDWLKFQNPEAPAVKREAEEDWGRRRWR